MRRQLYQNGLLSRPHQVYLAAHETDDPDREWMSLGIFTFWLAHGWDGDPREVWAARAGWR
jgi:hypothetical protein